MRKMIFYYTLDLKEVPMSASQLRPIKMLQGFKNLGFDVIEITGDSKSRKAIISTLTDEMLRDVEFLYMESATIPFFLTDKDHIPRNFLLEWIFFSRLKKLGVHLSIFYRDIHWKYTRGFSIYNLLIGLFHKLELLYLSKLMDIIYLPSIEMAKFLPEFSDLRILNLPPGHKIYTASNFDTISTYEPQSWKTFYVGGIGEFYDLRVFFEATKLINNIQSKFCFRQNDWNLVNSEYGSKLNSRISVVFKHSKEIELDYRGCDIFVLVVEPIEYWSFAIPYKFYEAIGYEKPILASRGTLIGSIVNSENIGWVIDNTVEEISNFFKNLTIREYLEKKNAIISYSKKNRWTNRCESVIENAQLN